MPTLNFLYQNSYAVNDKIRVVIPKVGDIVKDEDAYYGLVTILTASPIDLIVELDDMGIDFASINDWDLFLMLFEGLKRQDTSLVFGDLDLSKFEIMTNTQNGNLVIRDDENDITIDRVIHGQIAAALRKILHLKKDRRKPGNEEARKYMIERARTKRKRKPRKTESQLESLIVAMVNCEQFKYDYEGVLNLTIYQFNESVQQIIKLMDYKNKMVGVYTGSISSKDLKPEDFNWLSHAEQ